MISITAVLILVWMHLFADFFLQTEYQAHNKSSNNKVLATHVLVYSLPFLVFGILFALVNFVLHFATDYVSSRMTKKLAVKARETNNWHWFFAVVGVDQAIHMTCLVLTYAWLVQ